MKDSKNDQSVLRELLEAERDERTAYDRARACQIKGAARQSWQRRATTRRQLAEKSAERMVQGVSGSDQMEKLVLTIESRGMMRDRPNGVQLLTFHYPSLAEAKADFAGLQQTGQDFSFCGFPFYAQDLGKDVEIRTLEDWFNYGSIDEVSMNLPPSDFTAKKADFNKTGNVPATEAIERYQRFFPAKQP